MSRRVRLLFRLVCVLAFAGVLGAVPSPTAANVTVLLAGFPTLKQQRPLTCESAAASMGTQGTLTESQIMALLRRYPNPNLGFRGNPNGEQGQTLRDYGVYAQPIHDALARYGYRSDVINYGNHQTIVSYINRGWPLVAWVTYALQKAQPRLVQAGGTQFFLVPHEHAVLVVGYDQRYVFANDPWTGRRVAYDWPNFNRAWGYFANMALAMESCPMPQAVQPLRVDSLSTDSLAWSWPAAANAVAYKVRVIRHGAIDRVVYQGVQKVRTLAITQPRLGVSYEIVVRSVSRCNGTARSTRLWTYIPTSLPASSLTPTPVEGGGSLTATPVPSSTPLPTAFAGAPIRATALASATPKVTATP